MILKSGNIQHYQSYQMFVDCRVSSDTLWTLRTLDTQGKLDGIGNVLGVNTVFETKSKAYITV